MFDSLDKDKGSIGDIWHKVKNIIKDYTQGKPSPYSGHTLLWYLNRLLHENSNDTNTFLANIFEHLPEELLEAQRDFMYSPDKLSENKFNKCYNAHWFAYLKGHRGQVKKGRTYINFSHDKSNTLDDHLEKLYFRRRFGYGKYNIT